ncbi:MULTISPECIES: type II toxin-antitoxin system RelB/DinJ family antitoxin [Leuconostoc]|uniref:Type II toxin-antitoxin system RelB/DinJ family antitoxin n=1 Tax=Leuconostoc gelidum subsp. gelidum TaxID=1607839 RepID=A0AB35FZG7_LEUGE|nr:MULTISPECIES: type II toxin-antitoxin system RelB/DinJ family antitoxin [Leuconostoc]MBZ6016016.1 type II toxin-antitoxin system RelB/DinJ family antitoxin [Leuconostoc gelidum subsp. gelidum]
MTTSATSIRMDDDLKKAVNTKLDALGMNFNTFVVMASKQLVAQNRLPFDTTVPQAFGREAAIEELNQMLTISDSELKYNRDQAKPVQQVSEELADYHFD